MVMMMEMKLPVTLLNSSMISALLFDLGMLPTNRRRLGTLMFTFRCLPPFISISFNCVRLVETITQSPISYLFFSRDY